MAEIGYAEGACSRCGKILIRKRPADIAVCDCYEYCSLCGAKMTSFTPDLTPSTYGAGESFAVKGQAVEAPEWTMETLYVCNNHTPPYYSNQKPVEVRLS